MDELPVDVSSLYEGIINLNERLRALDHLSHALSLPIDLPACALVLHGLLCDLEGLSNEHHQSATHELSKWVTLRNLPNSIKSLLFEQHQVTHLDQLSLDSLNEKSLMQPILLWILAVYWYFKRMNQRRYI